MLRAVLEEMAPQKRRGPTATSMPAAKTSQKRRGPTAKSLAAAKTRVKNGKRKERRSAVEELNVLAQEVGAFGRGGALPRLSEEDPEAGPAEGWPLEGVSLPE